MIILRRYNKKGSSVKYSHRFSIFAIFWLVRHIRESEWCWIAYRKESDLDKV